MESNCSIKQIYSKVEFCNIVETEENAGDQHFLLFTQCLQKASFSKSYIVGIVC